MTPKGKNIKWGIYKKESIINFYFLSDDFVTEAGRLLDQRSAILYDVLDVSKDASYEEIRTAYRRLAFILHPDRSGERWKSVAGDLMKRVNEAYAILTGRFN